MASTVYGQFYAWIDGELLGENMSLEIMLDGDDKDVFTTVKGFAGQMPVPKKVVVNFGDVVARAGIKFDAWKRALDSTVCELKLQDTSGKSLTTDGFIRKPKITSGVDRTPEHAFEFHGAGKAWEGGVTT